MNKSSGFNIGLEAVAVITSVMYTWMYLKGILPEAFIFAAVGAAAFTYLCYEKKIYAETALQIFYIGFAVYGFFLNQYMEEPMVWDEAMHIKWLSLNATLTFALGFYLKSKTESKLPFLDAFTTVFSLGATWMMINLIHENWLYWIVIDTVAIALYFKRGLKFGALLYILYLLLAIDGYFESISWF